MNHLADPRYRDLLDAAAAVVLAVSPANRRRGQTATVCVPRARLKRLETAIEAKHPGVLAQIEAPGPPA